MNYFLGQALSAQNIGVTVRYEGNNLIMTLPLRWGSPVSEVREEWIKAVKAELRKYFRTDRSLVFDIVLYRLYEYPEVISVSLTKPTATMTVNISALKKLVTEIKEKEA